MKKTVLNLRNMGFVLVASTAMFAFSCGEETTEADTEAPVEVVEEIIEAPVEAPACDMGDVADSAAAMACDGGDAACDH